MLQAEATGLSEDVLAWSSALAAELLDERFEGQPAYLYLEPERLRALEETLGSKLSEVIAGALVWAQGRSAFWRFLKADEAWERAGKRGPPPFLALLVAMTNAAAAMVTDQSFSSHNYKDRLCRLLRLSGERADRLKRDVADTTRLWQALNDWLEEWEGALGLPTARVLGRLVNVGFPISQALVRASDRQAMREAFDHYGLTPRRRLGVTEMREYIGDWIGRGRAPASLQRAWRDENVRERIAQIACDELEHGEAVVRARSQGGGAAPPAKLEWIAELALEPFPRMDLFLASRLDPDHLSGRWSLGDRTDDMGRSAVAGCEAQLELRHLPDLAALSLEPWDQIGVTSLFSGVLELVRPDYPDIHLLRSPSAVVVLAYDERDGRYHETPRAQLLERCLVLAHDNIAGAVAKHLEAYARPGLQRLSRSALPQLPEGWQAFADVVLVQAAEPARHNARLRGLCASAATVIGFTGGLRIGQGTWHVRAPPEVLGVIEPETASLRVAIKDRRSGARRSLGRFIGRAAVDLCAATLEAGDYEAQLEHLKGEEATVVRRASLRLRSADHPRPVGVRRDLGLGIDLTRAWGLMSASRALQGPPSSWLRGGALAEPPSASAGPAVSVPALPTPARRPPVIEEAETRAGRAETGLAPHVCTLGPHYWECEPAGPDDDYKSLMWQECKNCHRFEWTQFRGVSTAAARPRAQGRVAPRQPSTLPRYARRTSAGVASYDLLLDALSYIGSGPIETFQRLCSELDPDPRFSWRALRELSSLAHIDVEHDPLTARPKAWQIAPPCLVQTETGELVLAGARSERLVGAVADALRSSGLALEAEAPEGGPTIWRASGGEPPLDGALREIATPIGVGVAISPLLSQRLASGLPHLSQIRRDLPVAPVAGRGLERFDLVSAAWVEAELDRPGAYRFDHWGRTYGLVDQEGLAELAARVAEPSLVKHLAAQQAGVSLLAYDPSRQALTTPLGAELPQLLERLAVMCSGRLPRLRSDLGQLEYGSVPVEIARALQRALHT